MDKKRWIIGGLVLFALFTVGAILAVASSSKERGKLSGEMSSLLSQNAIGIVEIEGIIYSSEDIIEELSTLEKDNSVKALVLRINSPGGAVAPSQEIYSAVMNFRSSGKPIVASFGSVAASGGYYIASAADTIMANPGTLTGSIGVIFEFPTAPDLMKKIGVDMEVVKSGRYKDAGGLHRRLNEDERRLFQVVIDDTWDQFVEAVAIGRGMEYDSVAKWADGRIMTGRQAITAGLVDLTGTYEDAKVLARELADLSEDAPEKRANTGSGNSFFERLMKQPKEILDIKNKLMFGHLSYLFKP
ncbi:MAG: signal peptide peptidase SppA [Fibrobacteres bacterium]|nr:signal peptide peptidase SppA [Fibrobacterota bacterium]